MSEKMSSSKEWLLAFAIAILVALVVMFYILIFKSPISELSEQTQSLSDSYVDQLNQEISIARQQGFLAQQQTKVEFLASVVEQGNGLLEDEATPNEKISIGGANYLREEVETDLQSRQERLETSAAQIDSTQRAIGRMQDALSNLKDLTQFDVNSISGEEALQAQLVALHSIGQLPWPTLSKRESVESAVKKSRADFDHRLGLLAQSSSPDLGDLFASMEESSVSNFHWREELGLNKPEMEYPGVTSNEEDLVAYLTRNTATEKRSLRDLRWELMSRLGSRYNGLRVNIRPNEEIAPELLIAQDVVVANKHGYTPSRIVPKPGDKIRFGPFDDPRDVSRLVIQVGNMSEVDLEPLSLSGGQWVGEVTIPIDSGVNSRNMPEKVRVKYGEDLSVQITKIGSSTRIESPYSAGTAEIASEPVYELAPWTNGIPRDRLEDGGRRRIVARLVCLLKPGQTTEKLIFPLPLGKCGWRVNSDETITVDVNGVKFTATEGEDIDSSSARTDDRILTLEVTLGMDVKRPQVPVEFVCYEYVK